MQEKHLSEYEAPQIDTLTDEQVLEELGAAQAMMCHYVDQCQV